LVLCGREMIYPSVYGSIVSSWMWGVGAFTTISSILFACALIWHLVLMARQRRQQQQHHEPVPTEWVELRECTTVAEDRSRTMMTMAALEEEDVEQEQGSPVPHAAKPGLLVLHLTFCLFMGSLCLWPLSLVAFDLWNFYIGLLALWAIVAVAWVLVSPPSLFAVLFSVWADLALQPSASTSPASTLTLLSTAAAAASYWHAPPHEPLPPPPSSSPLPSSSGAGRKRCRHMLWWMWAHGLWLKLVGLPSYEALKVAMGNREPAFHPITSHSAHGRFLSQRRLCVRARVL